MTANSLSEFLPLNERLCNPYTLAQVERKQLTAKIGVHEWNRLRIGISMNHGHQDQFISTLIHKFYELTRAELPKQHDAISESTIVRLIARLTLAPAGGDVGR